MEQTAPSALSSTASSAVVIFPDSRSRAEGSRLPMPMSAIVTVGRSIMTRPTPGSLMSCSAAAADPRTAGEGKKTGSAPVARASRSMRRVALTWTPGVAPPEELDDPGGHAGAEGGQLLDRGQPGGSPPGP